MPRICLFRIFVIILLVSSNDMQKGSSKTLSLLYIYIFITIALDESIFLDVLHFPMKNIKSRDLEATPMGGPTSKPIQ